MGVQRYQHTLLRKCWLAWQHYVSLERQRKDVHAEQDITRNKMASFLQAAGKVIRLILNSCKYYDIDYKIQGLIHI